MNKKNPLSVFLNGLIVENPVFVMLLGMCPTMAVTTSVFNGLGMGLAATFVLMCSNVVISLLRNIIPGKVRIASYIIIIATFVTIVQMLLKAYIPALDKSLGVFIPLIVVNCIILARAESFASKNNVFLSALDGLGMGLGFTFALTVMSAIRELLAMGTFAGLPVFTLFGNNYNGAIVMILPPGGFLTLGLVIAVINIIKKRKKGGEN